MARRLAVPLKPGDTAFGDRHRKYVAGHDLEAYGRLSVNLQSLGVVQLQDGGIQIQSAYATRTSLATGPNS